MKLAHPERFPAALRTMITTLEVQRADVRMLELLANATIDPVAHRDLAQVLAQSPDASYAAVLIDHPTCASRIPNAQLAEAVLPSAWESALIQERRKLLLAELEAFPGAADQASEVERKISSQRKLEEQQTIARLAELSGHAAPGPAPDFRMPTAPLVGSERGSKSSEAQRAGCELDREDLTRWLLDDSRDLASARIATLAHRAVTGGEDSTARNVVLAGGWPTPATLSRAFEHPEAVPWCTADAATAWAELVLQCPAPWMPRNATPCTAFVDAIGRSFSGHRWPVRTRTGESTHVLLDLESAWGEYSTLHFTEANGTFCATGLNHSAHHFGDVWSPVDETVFVRMRLEGGTSQDALYLARFQDRILLEY